VRPNLMRSPNTVAELDTTAADGTGAVGGTAAASPGWAEADPLQDPVARRYCLTTLRRLQHTLVSPEKVLAAFPMATM